MLVFNGQSSIVNGQWAMPKRNLIWLAAILAGTLVLVWVSRLPPPAGDGPSGALRPLGETYNLIEQQYLHPVDRQSLLRGAVRGMVESLDEYSSYVPPGRSAALSQRLMGTERGLGLRIRQVAGQVVVVGPLAGSPAYHAGILSGDLLSEIDGRPAAGMTLDEVRSTLDGEVGKAVKLTIIRDGWRKSFEVTREEFPVESVTGLYRDRSGAWVCAIQPEGAAYVRVREFVRDTPEQIQRLLRPMDRPLGLVLDLRGNPGGLLDSAVATADLLLREGLIVQVTRRRGPVERYNATAEGTFPPIPVVVLVDSRTASAAEIVAGALRVHVRAVLVGTRTCGKGCVQSMLSLPGGLGQVNLTTSEYFLDGSRAVSRRRGGERWGVDPHEQVILLPSSRERLADLRDQAEVLPATRTPATRPSSETASEPVSMLDRMLEADTQLARAVELLKNPQEMDVLLRLAAAELEAERAKPRTTEKTTGKPRNEPTP